MSQGTKNAYSSSPLKPHGGVSRFSNTKRPLEERRNAQCLNMHGKSFLVGDYDKFMDKFFGPRRASSPSPPENPDTNPNLACFVDIPTPTKEDKEMYNPIVAAVNGSNLCPGFICVSHPSKSGNGESDIRSADLGLYRLDPESPLLFNPNAEGGVEWSYIDLPWECKPAKSCQDPWPIDPPGDEPRHDGEKQTFGQILTYADAIFRHQQRTFFFMVIIIADEARIARIDRSSIFFSERFNYKEPNSKLSDFLTRYVALSAKERGWDVTAERVLPNTTLYNAMIGAGKKQKNEKFPEVRDMFRASLDTKWAWWKLKVPVTPDPKPKQAAQTSSHKRDASPHYKTFLVGKPNFIASGFAGRGTRGYIALPVEGEKVGDRFYYLKDAWRVDHPGIDQEGSILRELNKAKVKYVPTLYAHGDLPGDEQVTDWRAFRAEIRPAIDEEDCRLKRYQHYRLVVEEVCKSLQDFGESSLELIIIIYHCLLAHKSAYDLGFIHRDISTGNILIYRDPKTGKRSGVLNDWELAKRFGENISSAKRQPDRTGTLEYMSVHALNDPDREITLEDELESILHVVVHIGVRFVHSNLRAENAGHFLSRYFDDFSYNGATWTCGDKKRDAMKTGIIDLSSYNGASNRADAQLRFLWPQPVKDEPIHPLTHILEELLSWFEALYAHDKLPRLPDERGGRQRTVAKRLADMDMPEDDDDDDDKNDDNGNDNDDNGNDNDDNDDNDVFAPSGSSSNGGLRARTLTLKEQAKEDLRENLTSHDPFIKLLKDTIKTYDWPDKDRVGDKRPKKGYKSNEKYWPADSAPTCSMKRRREAEGGEYSSANKRSRR